MEVISFSSKQKKTITFKITYLDGEVELIESDHMDPLDDFFIYFLKKSNEVSPDGEPVFKLVLALNKQLIKSIKPIEE